MTPFSLHTLPVLVVLAVSSAEAAPGTPASAPAPASSPAGGAATLPTEAQRKNAEREFQLGLEAMDAGHDAVALQHFTVACLYLTTPVLLINTAETEIRLGKLLDAKMHLEQLVRLPTSPLEGPSSADARSRGAVLLPAVERRLVRVELDIALPPNQNVASVLACSVPVTMTGSSLLLNPGTCPIVVRSTAGQELVSDVVLPEGGSVRVRFDFVALAEHSGTAPRAAAPLSRASASPPPPAPKSESKSPSTLQSVLRYGGLGVGGLGLVAGSIGGLLAMSGKSTLDERCADGDCPPSERDTLDQARLFATISTIGFVAAGVGGVAFGVSYLGFSDSRAETAGLATVSGSF